MSKLIYKVDGGIAKTLEVYEDHLALVAQKTAKSFLLGSLLDGKKEFFYENLTSIQFRGASALVNGYLQIEYPGSKSPGFGITDNFGSENSFVFSKTRVSNDRMQEVADYIRTKIREAKQPQATTIVNNNSPADELKKYKELLDSGVINQEEFDLKKKELLGI